MTIADLKTLIKSMRPKLIGKKFVFCTVSVKKFSKMNIRPVLVFKEKEGITLIVEKKAADKNELSYSGTWSLITLTVNSDLNAVGFLAAITKPMAESGISVNAVSAYYHDHIFVPENKARESLRILNNLSRNA